MSLVGTRPILQDELRQYELHHRARIAIKPGITGMWQVSGRSDITDFEEVVRLDTEYISKLYNIPSTGLRFFTVYGPAGRPDMAYFGFTNKLVKGETIKIFNYGNCKRDFTYVDDIVEGVVRVMKKAPDKKNGEDGLPIPPYAVYNIGNQNPENLLDFVQILSEELVRAKVLPEDYDFEAHKELVPMQPGDVPVTYADTSALEHDFGYKPSTDLRTGLRKFAEWYAEFYK